MYRIPNKEGWRLSLISVITITALVAAALILKEVLL